MLNKSINLLWLMYNYFVWKGSGVVYMKVNVLICLIVNVLKYNDYEIWLFDKLSKGRWFSIWLFKNVYVVLKFKIYK